MINYNHTASKLAQMIADAHEEGGVNSPTFGAVLGFITALDFTVENEATRRLIIQQANKDAKELIKMGKQS